MIYRFYSNPAQGNRVSVVGCLEKDTLKIAVARTGKNENFCRRKGRAIAEGRLLKDKTYTTIPMVKDKLTSEEFIEIAQKVAEEVIKTKKVINGKN